jgi:hypothetical protein
MLYDTTLFTVQENGTTSKSDVFSDNLVIDAGGKNGAGP